MPDAAVTAASAVQPSDDEYTVVVPVSNPRTESNLLELASIVAKANDGVVQAVHVVQVPDQTPLEEGSEHVKRIDEESQQLMAQVRESTETLDVPVDVRTVVSHRSLEEVFDVARREQADTVVMGWGSGRPWSAGRAERPLDELTDDLPCDFLVFDDRGTGLDRVLVPTAGGPDSELSAEIARYLRERIGAEITLLHVVDDPDGLADGEAFLEVGGRPRSRRRGEQGRYLRQRRRRDRDGGSRPLADRSRSDRTRTPLTSDPWFRRLRRRHRGRLFGGARRAPSSRSLRERLFGK